MALTTPTKRSRFARRTKTSPNIDALVALAARLSQSSCRIEDGFWEGRLMELINKLLRSDDEAAITGALDQLFANQNPAYERLIDLVEAVAESSHTETPQPLDCVLIAIPVLAWSRYQIASGRIPAEQLADLRVHVQAHLLAADTRLALADFLFSPDQLPQSYVETLELTNRLVAPALHGKDIKVDADKLPETVNFLSDTRYLLGVAAATRGAPLFRWQENDSTREEALRHWREQGGEVLRRLLPACAIEFVPAGAYHAAVRDADRASRPYSVQAGVAFLQTVLNQPANAFRAIIGAYYEQQIEEYRIGFTFADAPDVVHGVVWPLLDSEEESSDVVAQIETVLRECGITNILVIDQRLPLEFCDDCGAPLYPNPEGEAMHAEIPEGTESPGPHNLH
jgi:hypothetical protein